jgi:hypothetical protein
VDILPLEYMTFQNSAMIIFHSSDLLLHCSSDSSIRKSQKVVLTFSSNTGERFPFIYYYLLYGQLLQMSIL